MKLSDKWSQTNHLDGIRHEIKTLFGGSNVKIRWPYQNVWNCHLQYHKCLLSSFLWCYVNQVFISHLTFNSPRLTAVLWCPKTRNWNQRLNNVEKIIFLPLAIYQFVGEIVVYLFGLHWNTFKVAIYIFQYQILWRNPGRCEM